MGKLKALVFSGAGLLLSLAPALAADLLPPPAPIEPPAAMPVAEFSGWYLRGDIGIGQNTREKFRSSFAPGFVVPGLQYDSSSVSSHVFAGVGVGYQFNSWLRADVTGEWRGAARWRAAESYTDPACGPAGRCVDLYRGNISSGVFLANGYVDLGTWYGFTPYVGIGVGTANNRIGAIHDRGVNTGGFGTSPAVNKWVGAWAIMAGASVNVGPNMKIDFGYRYLDAGKMTGGAIVCQPVGIACGFERHSFRLASHDFRVGWRYMFGGEVVAPPPPMAPPPLVRKY